nr:hypothetical protein [Tanacetum cinerariifolium]
MFDEYLEPNRVERPVPPAQAVQAPVNLAGTPSSTTIDQDAPSLSISPSNSALQSLSLQQGVAAEPNYMEDHTVAPVDNNPFVNVFAPEPHSAASSSGDISLTESPYLADIFTKALPRQRFEFILSRLDTMADINVPSGTLLLPPPYHQFTSSSSEIRSDMTRKLGATGVSWINSGQTKFVSAYNWEEEGHSNCDPNHPVHQANYPLPSEEAQVPLHLPNEEPVLGYLKFSAKGTKREVFGMPILCSLITADIQEASYYQEYLANVAKHRRYLAGESGSDPDSPAPKPAKPARKPKSTAPKATPRISVSTPVTSAQPAPTSAPAKPQEKKRKQATETSDTPSKAKKSKYGFVGKKRSLMSVAESVAKDAPAKETQVAAEDADLQKALEESMKSMYAAPQGPLPPVVIREPESKKYQPLPEVPRKGKAKVIEKQVAHDLLSLQKPKKKIPMDQYIFQRRTSIPTGSSGHDEPSYTELGQSKNEESKKVVPGADEGGQGKGQAGPDPGAQAEGQTGSDAGAQDEGQAESNPNENFEGQVM